MKLLELYIDGQRVNYRERQGFPLSLTMSIADAEDPSKVSGAHSKRQVSLPGDSETERLFEEWTTAGRQNPGAGRQKPARIEVNGLPIFVGVAQLDEATAAGARYHRVGNEYKVGLFGNNASWFDAVKDRKISSFGLIPEHTLDDATVSANDNPTPGEDDWGYCLIRTRDWVTPGEVALTELSPFMFLAPMIKKAFALTGYKIVSDFFEGEEFKRRILPVPFRAISEDVLQRLFLYVEDVDNPTTINSSTVTHITIEGDYALVDAGGNYNTATGFYTVAASGEYNVTVIGRVNYFFALRKNASNANILVQSLGVNNDPVSAIVTLQAGDTVDLVALSLVFTECPIVHMTIEPAFDFEDGNTINFPLYANPEWVMGDLLQGVTQAYGLQWDTDPDSYTVRVEPRDSHVTTKRDPDEKAVADGFFHSTERDDLTPRIDLSKEAEIKNLSNIKERYALAWKTDGGDANQEPLDSTDEVKFLNARYNFPAGRYQSGTTENENKFFAKTIHLLDESIKHSSSDIIPQIPVMQSQPYGEAQAERGDFEPRMLHFAGRRGGLDGYVKLADGSAYDYPAAFMVNYNDTDGFDPSLSFNTERLRNNQTVPGLLQRFHLQHLKRLEVSKQITEYIRWNEVDVLRLDFRRKVLLYNELYLLQSINGYKPLRDDTTETILLLDAIPEPGDVNKISGTTTRAYLPKNA